MIHKWRVILHHPRSINQSNQSIDDVTTGPRLPDGPTRGAGLRRQWDRVYRDRGR